MKKIKQLFSSAKNNSDNASFRGSLGKRNSSLSSIAGQSLNYDIKPKDLDKIHKAVLKQDEKKVELLAPKYVNTRDKGERTPLHLACAIGNVAIVEKLLSWKALINVPDRENKTPLFKAIECGHEDCAKLLIQTKVGLTVYDKDGNSCLHHLCIHGMTALIPLVLDKLTVADTEKKNKFGQNPLHIAIEKNNAEAIEMLLKKGVSPNTYNQNNITPLMMACYRGHKNIVLQLLKHEADPSLKDSNGNTAADLAMKMGHEDCVKEIEYFHEKDAEASGSNEEEEQAVDGSNFRRPSQGTRTDEAEKRMKEIEENEEDASSDESEEGGNDFYKGKANLMLSKILKDDRLPYGAEGGDPDLGVQLAVADKMTKNMLTNHDDDEEEEDDDMEEEITPLSLAEKKKEIPALKDQMQILEQSGKMNSINLTKIDEQPIIAGTSISKHNEDDESCWDTSCEDAPDNILNEQPVEHYFEDEKVLESQNGTFPLSEIKYPIMTEKFHLNSQSQNEKKQSPLTKPPPKPVRKEKDESFPESSDDDLNPFPPTKQEAKGRRSSSIENQIGTFIKNNDLRKDSVKEEKGQRKSFISDWDSVSEKSSHASDQSVQELKQPNETLIPTSISPSLHTMKQVKTFDMAASIPISKDVTTTIKESKSELTEELKALKTEVGSLKDVISSKEAEVEQLKRNLNMMEDENFKLKTKPIKVDDVVSNGTSLLKEQVDNLQKELDKVLEKNTELKELNEDLRSKLNLGNKTLDQMTEGHKMEISTLKGELSNLENKLKEHHQAKQKLELEVSSDTELRMSQKKLVENLKNQLDACKEHERQLAEQKSKIANMELDNNHLRATLDGKINRCNELEKEVDKLTSKHDDIMREFLAEKDKSIYVSVKSETQREKIEALLKELENVRGMNQSISSSSEILLKAEYDQKVSLLEEMNEDMKRTVSKLREELDLQRKKHEDECRTLTVAKNELFNKLVLAESALKNESISKQFLENELHQLTTDSQTMKQKLSDEQNQRQAMEVKLISLNQIMEASKSSSTTIESKLNQKSDALVNVEKENESLKLSIHKIELEKVKLDASLKMERQLKENLQEELVDLKNKLTESLRESFEHHKMKKHLQEKVQDLIGSKDMAVMEAENHRELWENEIKSKSKLGLREQMKLRKALERNHNLTEELEMEKHRGNILSQKLVELNKISANHSKNKVKYNQSRYMIDTSCKKCRKTKDDEERIFSKDIMKEAERMKREIEQKTQSEFMEKLQQVYQFLEEQTIIRSRNEQKRMENLELYRNNLFNSLDQRTPSFHRAFGLDDKPNKIQALFEELKSSENKLRGHLSSSIEAFHPEDYASTHPTIHKGYSTEDILQQLEKSIKTCSSTI